jgi:hypothetical protein
VSVQLHATAASPPGKEPPVPIGWEAEWASETVWTTWRGVKSWQYRDLNSDPSAVAIPTALSSLPFQISIHSSAVIYKKTTNKSFIFQDIIRYTLALDEQKRDTEDGSKQVAE